MVWCLLQIGTTAISCTSLIKFYSIKLIYFGFLLALVIVIESTNYYGGAWELGSETRSFDHCLSIIDPELWYWTQTYNTLTFVHFCLTIAYLLSTFE